MAEKSDVIDSPRAVLARPSQRFGGAICIFSSNYVQKPDLKAIYIIGERNTTVHAYLQKYSPAFTALLSTRVGAFDRMGGWGARRQAKE